MWRRNLTTQYFSLFNYSNSNLLLQTELNQRKYLIYKLKRKINNKKIQLNQSKKMNIYDIDELRYYSRQTFSCWKDLFLIVDSEK
jgi:hypothetical protein